MISVDVLFAWGGTLRNFDKNQTIFYEGNLPAFYYQVVEGSVRMVNTNEDGKEFIQGIFQPGDSFGEPVLLLNEPYPAAAVTNELSTVIKITKENFTALLKEHPDIHLKFTQLLAKRLLHKSIIAKEISSHGPDHRILTLLEMLKKTNGNAFQKRYKIEFSRQQIADMTGLRVETVIRTMKKLEDQGKLEISRGKVYV
jgi:CRP-like cAMP-binding protein